MPKSFEGNYNLKTSKRRVFQEVFKQAITSSSLPKFKFKEEIGGRSCLKVRRHT